MSSNQPCRCKDDGHFLQPGEISVCDNCWGFSHVFSAAVTHETACCPIRWPSPLAGHSERVAALVALNLQGVDIASGSSYAVRVLDNVGIGHEFAHDLIWKGQLRTDTGQRRINPAHEGAVVIEKRDDGRLRWGWQAATQQPPKTGGAPAMTTDTNTAPTAMTQQSGEQQRHKGDGTIAGLVMALATLTRNPDQFDYRAGHTPPLILSPSKRARTGLPKGPGTEYHQSRTGDGHGKKGTQQDQRIHQPLQGFVATRGELLVFCTGTPGHMAAEQYLQTTPTSTKVQYYKPKDDGDEGSPAPRAQTKNITINDCTLKSTDRISETQMTGLMERYQEHLEKMKSWYMVAGAPFPLTDETLQLLAQSLVTWMKTQHTHYPHKRTEIIITASEWYVRMANRLIMGPEAGRPRPEEWGHIAYDSMAIGTLVGFSNNNRIGQPPREPMKKKAKEEDKFKQAARTINGACAEWLLGRGTCGRMEPGTTCTVGGRRNKPLRHGCPCGGEHKLDECTSSNQQEVKTAARLILERRTSF